MANLNTLIRFCLFARWRHELQLALAVRLRRRRSGRCRYQGQAGDCACRFIAIATGKPYQEVYDALKGAATSERPRKGRKRSSVRDGTKSPTIRRYMEALGWRWVPTMAIGSGCKVHLLADELPDGRLVVSVSKHMTAVIDGVIRDTYDPSRAGTRCVYGYFAKEPS